MENDYINNLNQEQIIITNNEENDIFVTPDLPSNEFSKIITKKTTINKFINSKRRKAITDIEVVSDTDNDYSSDINLRSSQSNQTRITKLQNRIKTLEDKKCHFYTHWYHTIMYSNKYCLLLNL